MKTTPGKPRLSSALSICSLLALCLATSLLMPSANAKAVDVGSNVGSNVSIVNLSQDRQQVEPTIAVDPRNDTIVVAGAQDYRLKASGGHRWHGYYRSTDGGDTWTQNLLPGYPSDGSPKGLVSPLKMFNATSDPVLAFDRNGNVYYAGVAFNIPSTGISTAFVAKYLNDGADYAGTTLVGGATFADKPWIAIDDTGGPNDGNIYLAFDAIIGHRFGAVFTRSTDGGNAFSTPFFVPGDGTGERPGLAISPNGDVFVSTLGDGILVSKLTNGGATFAQTIIAANPVFSLPSHLPGNSFRTFTIPQIRADSRGVYLVWDDFRTGDADVLVSRSTDDGSTWTSPLRVNDVPKRQQFFPTVAVAGGIISIAWYDSRLNSGNSEPTITDLDVYYSQSTDGGSTFSKNVRITNVSFDPNLVERTDAPNTNEPFIGDYIHIASRPGTVHAIWSDNRNACDTIDPTFGCVDQDVFTARVTVSAPSFHDVAVPNMRVSRNFDYAGVQSNPIQVNVTVSNLGSTSETVTVRAFANTTLIGTGEVAIGPGRIALVQFPWNAHMLPRGTYHLSAQALQVMGEASVSDNVFDDGLFTVRFKGDVNGDCNVNIIDLATIGASFDRNVGQSGFNLDADLNNDGQVSSVDLTTTATNFGKSCP